MTEQKIKALIASINELLLAVVSQPVDVDAEGLRESFVAESIAYLQTLYEALMGL